jgi:hypothetical protein
MHEFQMSSQRNVSKDCLSTRGHKNCLQHDVLKAAFQLGMIGGCLQSCVLIWECIKKILKINFIYLNNKEIYCIFKTCCKVSVLFHTKKAIYFIILSFSDQTVCFSQIMCLIYIPPPSYNATA